MASSAITAVWGEGPIMAANGQPELRGRHRAGARITAGCGPSGPVVSLVQAAISPVLGLQLGCAGDLLGFGGHRDPSGDDLSAVASSPAHPIVRVDHRRTLRVGV